MIEAGADSVDSQVIGGAKGTKHKQFPKKRGGGIFHLPFADH